MAYINYQRSYIRFKVVYYGPGLGGKTTNLEQLHEMSGKQGEMISLETEGDRTIFFDYMPLNLGKLGGVETVLKLYTVPGQVRYNRTRRMVLRDVDGIVFVADSQRAAMPDNEESLRNLGENLADEGIDLSSLPMVMQYNKRDLDDIASVEELDAVLNPGGLPVFEASAVNGENVRETLKALSSLVYQAGVEKYGLKAAMPEDGVEREPDSEAAEGPVPEAEFARDDEDRGREDDSWTLAPGGTDSTPADVVEERWSSPPGVKRDSQGTRTIQPEAGEGRAEGDGGAAEAISILERKVFAQFVEMREILQQIVMTQLEQESFEEYSRRATEEGKAISRNIEGVADSVARVEDMIVELARGMERMQGSIDGLREDINRVIRKEVDDQLAEFLADLDSSEAGEQKLIPISDDPSRDPAPDRVRSDQRKTAAPPRSRSGGRGRGGAGSRR